MTDESPHRPPGWRRVFDLPSHGKRLEAGVEDEIAFHLAMRAERLRAHGMDDRAAHDAARQRFGDVEHIRRECVEIDRQLVRHRRATDYLEELMQDLVFAIRGLRRAPGFAAAALLTLALGIGAATAIFSVAYGVLFRPLPYPAPDRLVEISVSLSGIDDAYGSLSAPEYVDLATGTRSFSDVGAYTARTRTLASGDGEGNPERIVAASATASLFRVLGVRASVGRTYVEEEDVAGGPLVIVLSDALWRRRFGADPSLVGQTVHVDGLARTVVGVLPPDVRVAGIQAYTPMGFDPAQLPGRGAHFLRVIGRLRPGVTVAQARDELTEFARRSSSEYATNYGANGFTSTARPLREAWYGNAKPMMTALVASVGLLLLLAAVNVANLLLVRAESRQREMGVRVALGASGRRLVRQLLTESVLLAVLGGLIGVPLAALGVRSLLAISPNAVPPGAEVSIDVVVLAAVFGVVAIAALVAGIAPAMRARSTDVRSAIAAGSAGGGTGGGRLRSVLVVTEVALAAAMLVGAGLVGRSFEKLLSVDPGFEPQNVLVATLALPRARYDTSTKVIAFYEQALERMRTLPGVTTAAALTTLPLGGGTMQWSAEVEGRPDAHRELSTPYIVMAMDDVFQAMGIQVVRGRGFTTDDRAGTEPVTVVSEAMAREYWPGEDALGKRIKPADPTSQWMTVIGIVRDVRPEALSEPPRPTYYVLTPQFARMMGFAEAGMTLVLRTASDPASLTNPARGVIRELDPRLPLDNVRTLESVVAGSVTRPRFAVTVLGVFAVSALVLAVVGVYGVLSYAMERRRKELALRIALGAGRGAVRNLVMRSGLLLAGAGAAVGLLVAFFGSRMLATLLYEVSPTDPVTNAGVAVTLLGAAALASWLPARRAMAVNPADTLRGD